jgi:hypothetical protein
MGKPKLPHGDLTRLAAALGISKQALYMRLKRHPIELATTAVKQPVGYGHIRLLTGPFYRNELFYPYVD